jgi:hypothetical protein
MNELDNKISLLKGLSNMVVHSHSPKDNCKGLSCLKYYDSDLSGAKKWSSNIADAWELACEFPCALVRNKDDLFTCSFLNSNNEYELGGNFLKAAEAICLAWIKWKESQNEQL